MLRLLLIALLLTSIPAPISAQDSQKAQFVMCGSAKRVTCVVDGDTFWLRGTKYRIADINTPETSRPGCARERDLGNRASARMLVLLNQAPFGLKSSGRDEDRFGRKLRVVTRSGSSLGAQLVREGLAERWTGKRRNWC